MSTATDSAEPQPRLFNVKEYYQMAKAGILQSDEHLELVEGRILQKYPPQLRLFTADEYENLTFAGIISEDEAVELVEGVILTMSPKSPRHSNAVRRADTCFRKRIGDCALIMTQDTVRLNNKVELEPELVLFATPLEKYETKHPGPEDIFLILEIAETSLNFESHRKSRLYAQAGIIQYLVLNTRPGELEEFSEPGPTGYRIRRSYDSNENFTLIAFPDVSIPISDLLPPV